MGLPAGMLSILLVTADVSASVKVTPGNLARGINMDHIFDPYRGPEKPWKPEDTARIAKALDPAEFALAAKLGFTHIRLNIGRDFIQQREVPFSFREDGMKLLDRAIAGIHAAGLAVVLDLHPVPPPDIGNDPRERRTLEALWKRLAKRYRGNPAVMAFEILNEPRVADYRQWRQTTLAVIEAVRRIDRQRTIVVSGADWASADELMKGGNLGQQNLFYTFHFYEPFVFTHQGAGWSGKVLGPLHDIRYPIEPAQMDHERTKASAAGLETWPFDDWTRAGGAAEIEQRLLPLMEWAKREHIRLYCGEFGVHKPNALPADRARWISDMVRILAKHEVGWAMWAWRSGFDLVDDGGVPDPAIVQALGLR